MKIAVSWLKQYIDLPGTISELCDALTFSGIEVEGVKSLAALPDTVITAYVQEASPLPDSDHLKLCKIDIGTHKLADPSILDSSGMLQVVCGASNCASGMKVILALPGTDLGEIKIKSAKIRGTKSHGMLCSESELGISEDHSGIISLPEDTPVGISPNAILGLPDTILELEITPNRSDLLGYYGIATDLSASLNEPIKPIHIEDIGLPKSSLGLSVRIDDYQSCPRYTAQVFEGIKVEQSPLWLRLALGKSGIRSINNIVDITNYVLLATGQPLHAFDYDLLQKSDPADQAPFIIVRKARNEEIILALDGIQYNLDCNDLVIADGQRATAIAGVMGGEETGVSTQTKSIVLETAAFNPSAIRRTSYKHKVSSDSSYRFERHLSPWALDKAQSLARNLICELGSPEAISEVIDIHTTHQDRRILGIRPCRFKRLIGFELSDDEIRAYLGKLGLEFISFGDYQADVSDIAQIHCHHAEEARAGKTEFTEAPDCIHSHFYWIPFQRVDLEREVDLIEELARLAGYDKVPHKLPVPKIMDRHGYSIRTNLEDYMVSSGYYEVYNYSFEDPTRIKALGFREDDQIVNLINLINPQSANQSSMRSTLLPSLLGNLSYNLNHGERDLKLFEMAKVYLRTGQAIDERMILCGVSTGTASPEHWLHKTKALDYFHIKGLVEQILDLIGLTMLSKKPIDKPYLVSSTGYSYRSDNKEIASFGMMRPDMLESYEIDTITLKQDVWTFEFDVQAISELTKETSTGYTNISKYPSVVRDLSLLLRNEHSYETLRQAILEVDPLIIEQLRVFDEYRSDKLPDGYRSISLHLFLRDTQKTLTEERIERLVDSVLKNLETKLEVIMR